MFHYINSATNTRGNALPGWFVEARLNNAVVPIYLDSASTPIVNVSGVENRAKVDGNGNYDFWVNEGTYDLYFYNASGVQQSPTLLSVQMDQTRVDLASRSVGKGASLVANANGGTVQDALNYLPGPMIAGVWEPFTGLPRLRLSGTGTVTIDANTAVNGTGTTTAAVFTASPAGSTTIAFPFFGTDAVAVRATYTGTALAEII